MIDVHSHVLWGLDDGAETLEDSVAMLVIARAAGTTDIVATPHANARYKYNLDLIAERIRDLEGVPADLPFVHRGCDFHLSLDNINEALREPAKFTVNGRNHLLVEFSDTFIPPSTEEIFRQFIALGIVPVITHPERNPILQGAIDRLRIWTAMGCLMQVTAQSLTDRFGKAARSAAFSMLSERLVHVIASDGHDTVHRPPRLDAANEILHEKMGSEAADLLLIHNPRAILEGGKVWLAASGGVQREKKRKWFFFGRFRAIE